MCRSALAESFPAWDMSHVEEEIWWYSDGRSDPMQPLLEPQGAPSNPCATCLGMAGGITATALAQPDRCSALGQHEDMVSCCGCACAYTAG